MTLHIDIETYSEEDLKESGVYRYAEHPSTEINVLGYAINDGPVRLWIPCNDVPPQIVEVVTKQHPGVTVVTRIRPPAELLALWHEPKRAHNAQFERVVLNGAAGIKLGLPKTEIHEWTCTAVKVACAGLPRSLEEAAKALGTHPKSNTGRIEMLQLSKPKRATKADPSLRYTPNNAPDKWAAMLCYNVDDVLAERDLDDNLPDISENEQRLYHLDQKINERGWAVDLKAVNDILFVVEEYKAQLAAECDKLTLDWMTGEGLKPTQREKIADWVRENGYSRLADMTADTIKKAVTDQEMPACVRRVLTIYSTYNAKSVSKLVAMLRAVCSDGRLRGMFLFYGAATGRWSSLIVQLQNMMRPVIKDPESAIEAFAARDLSLIRLLYPDLDPMKVAGSCIRGCLIGGPGAALVAPDFSGIEDRVNAWFFDEEWVLQSYRAYDTIIPGKFDDKGEPLRKGRHLYSLTACRTFGLDVKTFSDDDPRRQHGKVMRLAMGYEGGVSAFATMAETYQINLEEMAKIVTPLLPEDALDHAAWMHENHPTDKVSEEVETACNGLKYLYRRDHPSIVQGWKHLKEGAEKAVEHEGQTFWIPNKKIGFRVETYKGRKWLAMRLPSGRSVKYFAPKWTPPRESERWINNELVPHTIPGFMSYWGIDTYTRQWMELQTYGGKLDENADQAFSRDLLCNAMLALDKEGFLVIATEHDKVVIEVHERMKPITLEKIKGLMVAQPDYCTGLPLATDGRKLTRYGK